MAAGWKTTPTAAAMSTASALMVKPSCNDLVEQCILRADSTPAMDLNAYDLAARVKLVVA
jgi:hypothetical protein